MKPLPLDPLAKLRHHIDAIFGLGVSDSVDGSATFEFSRRTGRMKYFFVGGKLGGTFRTDGGIALTIHGAQNLLASKNFVANCVVTNREATPFVSEGRSLFCKHVERCGSNVKVGSEVAVLDQESNVIAVGVAQLHANQMKAYGKGVAVKTRQGVRSREADHPDKE